MADAVAVEPVSTPEFPATGKLTGSSVESTRFVRFLMQTREQFQRLSAEFPTQPNRGYSDSFKSRPGSHNVSAIVLRAFCTFKKDHNNSPCDRVIAYCEMESLACMNDVKKDQFLNIAMMRPIRLYKLVITRFSNMRISRDAPGFSNFARSRLAPVNSAPTIVVG